VRKFLRVLINWRDTKDRYIKVGLKCSYCRGFEVITAVLLKIEVHVWLRQTVQEAILFDPLTQKTKALRNLRNSRNFSLNNTASHPGRLEASINHSSVRLCVTLEFVVAFKIHIVGLWVMVPCSPVRGYRRFGGMCCLHILPWRWW
jgi:hypothetical protein